MKPPHLSRDPHEEAARDRCRERREASHAAMTDGELEVVRGGLLALVRRELAAALHCYRQGDDRLADEAALEAWSASWTASLADMELRRRERGAR